MKKYYLHNGEQQEGPFDITDLKNKGINPKTEIWYEGLSDWTKADQIEELNTLFSITTPPPFKPNSTTHTTKAKSTTVVKSNTGKNILILTLITIGVIVGLYVIAGFIEINSEPNPVTYVEQKMTIEEIENSEPTRFLNAVGEYNSSFWGTELKIRGEITNTATIADYKDVTLRVTYYSKTKSVLTSKDYTLYEVYQPNSITPFRLDITNYQDVDAINWKVVRALPN